MPMAKPVVANTTIDQVPPNQPLPHKAMHAAPAAIQVATTRSLCLGKRAATNPPTNMPAAAHNM